MPEQVLQRLCPNVPQRASPACIAQAEQMDLAFAYRARPAADLPPTATKPETPSAFLAALTASCQTFSRLPAYALFARAELFFDTTLPYLFFVKFSFVNPPTVFCLRPENTEDFAREPRATMLTLFVFIALFFIADVFMAAAFMAMAFFIGSAM